MNCTRYVIILLATATFYVQGMKKTVINSGLQTLEKQWVELTKQSMNIIANSRPEKKIKINGKKVPARMIYSFDNDIIKRERSEEGDQKVIAVADMKVCTAVSILIADAHKQDAFLSHSVPGTNEEKELEKTIEKFMSEHWDPTRTTMFDVICLGKEQQKGAHYMLAPDPSVQIFPLILAQKYWNNTKETGIQFRISCYPPEAKNKKNKRPYDWALYLDKDWKKSGVVPNFPLYIYPRERAVIDVWRELNNREIRGKENLEALQLEKHVTRAKFLKILDESEQCRKVVTENKTMAIENGVKGMPEIAALFDEAEKIVDETQQQAIRRIFEKL